MKNMLKAFALFTTMIVLSFLSAVVGVFVGVQIQDDTVSTQNVTRQDVEIVNEESAVIDVAQQASNAVVSIVITKDIPVYETFFYNPYEGNPFFDGFSIPERRQTGTQEQQVGSGSGFVVSEDGLIITNRHVVEDETASYTAIFANGERYEAEIVAKDTLLDIAFIQIDADNLEPLSLGSSENLQVGQNVIAVGNALGEFSNTVSTGIISGLSRDIIAGDTSGRNLQQIDDVIQTDASINNGNSGGPLLDIRGNVIGVNVAVAQNAENIGFAIPIDVVKDLIDRLNEDGTIDRPVLGVRYQLLSESIQEANDLPFDYGAIVIKGGVNELAVIPGSPADKAGIQENDIILEVDGVKITFEDTLIELIQSKKFGDIVELKVYSQGEIETLTIELENF